MLQKWPNWEAERKVYPEQPFVWLCLQLSLVCHLQQNEQKHHSIALHAECSIEVLSLSKNKAMSSTADLQMREKLDHVKTQAAPMQCYSTTLDSVGVCAIHCMPA